MSETLRRLTKARATLIMTQPFFGALSYKLKFEESPTDETMSVDGFTLRASPKFVAELSEPELVGVLAHEVAHCALGHIWRRGQRDPATWNASCDYAVNPMLVDAGLTLPKSRLLRDDFRDMAADEIYSKLYQKPKPDPQGAPKPKPAANNVQQGQQEQTSQPGNSPSPNGQGQGAPAQPDPGRCGGMRDAPSENPAEKAQSEQDWKIATIQAANAAKAQGNLPGSLARLAEQATAARVDWRAVLRRFVNSTIPSDYSVFPADKRFLAHRLLSPSLVPDRCGPIMVAIDTSGSIDAETLAQFASELNSILDEAQPERVHVIYCDTQVRHVDSIEPQDFPVILKAHGGGGTDYRPPFQWAAEHASDLECAIYFGDMQTSRWPEAPAYPVLWASTSHIPGPAWGETVEIKE